MGKADLTTRNRYVLSKKNKKPAIEPEKLLTKRFCTLTLAFWELASTLLLRGIGAGFVPAPIEKPPKGKMKNAILHSDLFSGVSYVVGTVAPMGASNDVGGPFDDGIRSERTRSAARSTALASLDVLTIENFATYAALMSA